jgi:hypothetical protein
LGYTDKGSFTSSYAVDATKKLAKSPAIVRVEKIRPSTEAAFFGPA